MVRIGGVDLPNKRMEVALTYIYGIGRSSAKKILTQAGVDLISRPDKLSEAEVTRIQDIIAQNYKIEGDLRKEVSMNIKRLMDLGCYRGLRHRKSLPVRGQRTRTNSRTRKGPRKTVAGRGKKRGAAKK